MKRIILMLALSIGASMAVAGDINTAQYDSVSGLLELPRVSVDGGKATYSVTLQNRVHSIGGYVFDLDRKTVALSIVGATSEEDNLITIKSPIIGTLYRKPSPEKPLFVEVGSVINVGDTVCIIEAMKLFNEIESEVSGTIVKILIDDSSPVEFDQPLFLVDPS